VILLISFVPFVLFVVKVCCGNWQSAYLVFAVSSGELDQAHLEEK